MYIDLELLKDYKILVLSHLLDILVLFSSKRAKIRKNDKNSPIFREIYSKFLTFSIILTL